MLVHRLVQHFHYLMIKKYNYNNDIFAFDSNNYSCRNQMQRYHYYSCIFYHVLPSYDSSTLLLLVMLLLVVESRLVLVLELLLAVVKVAIVVVSIIFMSSSSSSLSVSKSSSSTSGRPNPVLSSSLLISSAQTLH